MTKLDERCRMTIAKLSGDRRSPQAGRNDDRRSWAILDSCVFHKSGTAPEFVDKSRET